ncbi:cell surface protein, partial [Acinetobacter albensis]
TTSNIGGTGSNTIDGAISNVKDAATKAKTTVTQGDNIVVSTTTNTDGSTNYQVKTAKDVNFDSLTAGTGTDKTVLNKDGLTVTEDTQTTVIGADGIATDKVTVGSVVIDKTTNKISGVAAGAVNATSTDAVNGSQLFNTADNVKNVIGGATTIDATTGAIT